jgi:hypothetical protein
MPFSIGVQSDPGPAAALAPKASPPKGFPCTTIFIPPGRVNVPCPIPVHGCSPHVSRSGPCALHVTMPYCPSGPSGLSGPQHTAVRAVRVARYL